MNRSTVKYGSRGEDVKYLQKLLGIPVDGIAGVQTRNAIIDFQKKSGLVADGICGSKTWVALEKINNTTVEPSDLYINHYLKTGEYVAGNYPKDLIVLHHTAGFENPYNVISGWNSDGSVGRVATEFVIGGIRCTNGDNKYDGQIVHAYPTGAYGYHIGKAGVSGIDKRSVGIELCSFGHIKNGKTYTGAVCQPEQICHLDQPFRGYSDYHQYSDRQLESLRKLMLFIAERDNIDLHTGLYQWIKAQGVKAFDFQSDAYYGKVKNGVVTHANIRKDKEDVFPQPELIDMILSL